MKDNIYDLIISELILRDDSSSVLNQGAPYLSLVSSLSGNTVPENFNGSAFFTSTVNNIPSGYGVKLNTHVISYPTLDPPDSGSSTPFSGSTITVILGAVGSTFTVLSTVTLEHLIDPIANPDIILNGSFTITSVLPIYYGVKTLSLPPNNSSLSEISSATNQFTLTSTSLGRLYIGIPIANGPMVSITDYNGLVLTQSSNFTSYVVGSYNYYVLNYDTIFLGSNQKIFTINYL
jgi:hypothetical protein